MTGIFMSYRRADPGGYARRLHQWLHMHFGTQPFKDTDSLRPGDDFARELRAAVSSADALLAIIGPDWAEVTDGSGRRRLLDPQDWVRTEISLALSAGVPVIPVLMPGAAMPSRSLLPEDLRELAGKPSVRLRADQWPDDMEALVATLEGLGVRRQLKRIGPQTIHYLTVVRRLSGHTGGVSDVAFTGDGRWVVTAGGGPPMSSFGRLRDADDVASLGDSTVRVWRISDGSVVHTLNHDGWAVAVAVAPDGATLATGDRASVLVWNLAAGTAARAFPVRCTALTFSPGGGLLAAGADDGAVTIRRVPDGAVLGTGTTHHETVTSLAFAPDGATLASASRDRTVHLRRASDWAQTTRLRAAAAVRDVAFTPDGSVLAAACEDGQIRRWRVRDGSDLPALNHPTGWACSVAYAADGGLLASGSSTGALRLWPAGSDEPARTLDIDGQIDRLAFSADGSTLAAAVWNTNAYLLRVDPRL
jgi:WD40 repeat protein